MEYAIGILLALAVAGLGIAAGFDRDRVFYPTVLIVIALYYVLFAAMAGSGPALAAESAAAGAFLLAAVLGFKTRLWLVAVGLAGHGVFDFVHHFIIDNPGVPEWWPGFCLAFDVTAAGCLTVLITTRPALRHRKDGPKT